MGLVARVLVAATSLLAVPFRSAETELEYVQRMLYSTPLAEFLSAGRDPRFDWSTDGCSAPLVGDTGRTFNFAAACRRHDFGYRNIQLIERRHGIDSWNPASRRRIDQLFLADMKQHCQHRRVIDRPTCYSWALTFYGAVRVAGGP